MELGINRIEAASLSKIDVQYQFVSREDGDFVKVDIVIGIDLSLYDGSWIRFVLNILPVRDDEISDRHRLRSGNRIV